MNSRASNFISFNSSNAGNFFLELNFEGLCQSSRKEKESCYLVFPFSTTREIRHVHVEVVQRRPRNVQKSVMHVHSCCFDNVNLLYFCRSRCRRRRRCLSSLMAKPGAWDQDRWILAKFFSTFLWTETRSSSMKWQNWKRPIVDQTSMVNGGFIIYPKRKLSLACGTNAGNPERAR